VSEDCEDAPQWPGRVFEDNSLGYPLKAGQFYQDSDVISGKTFSTQSIA
jgi:hypothetical protein